MLPFLILQLRPETEAADDEYAAFLRAGGLRPQDTHRIRLDQGPMPDGLDLDTYSGVIVGGGPGCVSDAPQDKPPLEARIEAEVLGLMPQITARDMPFLGCCYGIGILGAHLGAEVGKGRYGEPVGPVQCHLTDDGHQDPLTQGLPSEFTALVGHKEALHELPQGCTHLVSSGPCPIQMLRHGQNVYATQFHPEADGDGFAVRIRIYRDKGYFAPGEAEALTARAQTAEVSWPALIVQNFVARYQQPE